VCWTGVLCCVAYLLLIYAVRCSWEARRRDWLARRMAEHAATVTLYRNQLVALEKDFIRYKGLPLPVHAQRSRKWVEVRALAQ
jgi:hypothetical protein